MKITDGILSRFWLRVEETEAGCWEWTGQTQFGVGYLYVDKKRVTPHKLSLFLKYGVLTRGVNECGNKLCCNPEHYSLPKVAVRKIEQARLAGELLTAVKKSCI